MFGKPPLFFQNWKKNHQYCVSCLQCLLTVSISRVNVILDKQGPLTGWHGTREVNRLPNLQKGPPNTSYSYVVSTLFIFHFSPNHQPAYGSPAGGAQQQGKANGGHTWNQVEQISMVARVVCGIERQSMVPWPAASSSPITDGQKGG
jgi:hypothetical protein